LPPVQTPAGRPRDRRRLPTSFRHLPSLFKAPRANLWWSFGGWTFDQNGAAVRNLSVECSLGPEMLPVDSGIPVPLLSSSGNLRARLSGCVHVGGRQTRPCMKTRFSSLPLDAGRLRSAARKGVIPGLGSRFQKDVTACSGGLTRVHSGPRLTGVWALDCCKRHPALPKADQGCVCQMLHPPIRTATPPV
jgi:hypothetical protein